MKDNKKKEKEKEKEGQVFDREKLLENAGNIVLIRYDGNNDEPCFLVGFFFQLTETEARLKITSTAKDTYESVSIPTESIKSIETFTF